MTNIADICQTLARVAPLELAESWDNVGLLTGDASADIRRAMTCLSISDLTAAEAIAEDAQLIVTHHPLPFRPVARLTCEQTAGRLLWQLTRAGVAIYSAHTAWDSAAQGINEQIAAGLHLEAIEPLRPIEAAASDAVGAGRWGRWPTPRRGCSGFHRRLVAV